MKIVCIGGGPAGLYFAILMKKADPAHDVVVVERNRPDDTFGFGVVFSDATLDSFARGRSRDARRDHRAFAHWDDIDIHYRRQVLTSTGHGFSGMSRQALLDILQRALREPRRDAATTRPRSRTSTPYADADLILARRRRRTARSGPAHAERFRPPDRLAAEPLRLARHDLPVPAPSPSSSRRTSTGSGGSTPTATTRQHSTFILETTEATWRRAGPRRGDEDDTVAFAEALFARELDGPPAAQEPLALARTSPSSGTTAGTHGQRRPGRRRRPHRALLDRLRAPSSRWRTPSRSPARCRRHRDVPAALAAYEAERRPEVESLQRAAQASLEWFEQHRALPRPPRARPVRLQPAHAQPARHAREPEGPRPRVRRDGRSAGSRRRRRAAERRAGAGGAAPPPPMFTPFRLARPRARRTASSSRRCASTRPRTARRTTGTSCTSAAARSAAPALVMAEMTDVSREGRISPGCTGMYKPEHVDAWKRIVDFVHGAHPRQDRAPARPRRAQGLDAAACGRGSTSRCRRATGRSCRRRRFRTSRTARSRAR